MIVYIVTHWSYDSENIVAVFSTQEKAIAFMTLKECDRLKQKYLSSGEGYSISSFVIDQVDGKR